MKLGERNALGTPSSDVKTYLASLGADDREVALVRRVRELALSRRGACLGLRDTLDAFNAGRVSHLILGQKQKLSGFRTIDGQLFRDHDKLAVQSGLMLLAEPRLIERMVKRARELGAEVIRLGEDRAQRDLSDYEGIAALLRW